MIKNFLLAILLAFAFGCSHMAFERRSLDPVQQYFSHERDAKKKEQNLRSAAQADYARATPYSRYHDVRVGMSMSGVKDAWGDPYQVDYAGEYNHGNQRWVYPLGATSHFGQSEARIVYFENGRVVGWETY